MDEYYLLGLKLIDWSSFKVTIFKYAVNFATVYTLIRFMYMRYSGKTEYLFTFILFNTLIFFVCLLLNSVRIEMGFAFGLFALFGLLRYRTGSLPLKEMTYLFVVIVVAVVNALMNENITLSEILLFNILTLILTSFLEQSLHKVEYPSKRLTYGNMEYIKPENKSLLLSDLESLTGYKIRSYEIDKIDLVKNSCDITITYEP